MNKAVASVLNKVLGDFIMNLNPEQLQLSVFKGKVKLQNLQLKPNSLEKLGLPFDLKFGEVGNIEADIPWSSLASSPLTILVENITAVLIPMQPKDWSEEEERKSYLTSQAESLSSFEALNHPDLSISDEPGYFERLVENIVNNVQVTIKNIYVRYEDKFTSSKPFCLGVKLNEACAVTCNEEWKPMYVKDGIKSFKLASVTGLSVFLDFDSEVVRERSLFRGTRQEVAKLMAKSDLLGKVEHKYVLSPLTLIVKAVINKDTKTSDPKVLVVIENKQELAFGLHLQHIGFIVKIIDFWNLYSTFKAGVASSFNPRPMNESSKAEYKTLYLEWRSASLKDPDSTTSKGLKNQLDSIEAGCTAESIKQGRYLAIKEDALSKIIKKKGKELHEIENEEEGTVSKIFGFFGGKSEADKRREAEEKKQKIDKIRSEISKIEAAKQNLDTSSFTDEIKDSSIFQLQLDINLISFKLFDDIELFSSAFNTLAFSFLLTSKSNIISASLASFTIKHTQGPSPFIINSKSLSFKFGANQLDLQTNGMIVMLDVLPLLAFYNKLWSYVSQQIDIDALASKAAQKTSKYIKSGRDYLKTIVQDGTNASLAITIHMVSPIIYIPSADNSNYLVVDLGKLNVISVKAKGKHSEFEQYSIEVEGIRLSTIWKLGSLEKWEKYSDILKPASIKTVIKLYNRKNKLKPGFKLFVDLLESSWNIIDIQLMLILGIVKLILPEAKQQAVEPATEIKEVSSLKENIKSLGDIVPWKIALKCESLSVVVGEELKEVLEISVIRVDVSCKIDMRSKMTVAASIQDFALGDPEGKVFKNVLVRTEDSLATVHNQGKHLKVLFEVNPVTDIIEISLALNSSSIYFNMEFINKVLAFTTNLLKFLPSSPKITSVPVTYTKSNSKLMASVRLAEIKLLVPLNPNEKQTNLLILSTTSMISYNSLQLGKALYDSQNQQCGSDTIKLDEEATLCLSHLSLCVSNYHYRVKNYILEPSRISLHYANFETPEVFETKVDVIIESLCIDVNFYDIYAFSKIASLIVVPETKEPAPVKAKRIPKLVCNVDGDSLQIQLYDLTSKAKAICNAKMSNISLILVFEPESKHLDFSTLIFSSCYNKHLGAWEPLLEDWKLDFNLSQTTEDPFLTLSFKSELPLNLNINSSILSQLFSISKSLSVVYTETSSLIDSVLSSSIDNYQYRITNYLESDIKVRLNFVGNQEYWSISAGGHYNFNQAIIDKIFMLSNPRFKTTSSTEITQTPAALNFDIPGFESIAGLIIEETSLNVFKLKNKTEKIFCAVEVTCQDACREIRVLSAAQICNNSNADLELNYHGKRFTVKSCGNAALPGLFKGDIEELIIEMESSERLTDKKWIKADDQFYSVEVFDYKTDSGLRIKSIEINPMMALMNLLPGALTIRLPECEYELKVGEKAIINEFNPEPHEKFQFELILDSLQEKFSSELITYSKSLEKIPIKNQTNSEFLIQHSTQDLRKNSCVNLQHYTRDALCSSDYSNHMLTFYAENIILNKTDHNLDFSGLLIPKHSWQLFNGKKGKIRLSDFESDWCKAFCLETVSLSGALEIPRGDDTILNLGVTISLAFGALTKTKIVTIVPRHCISNFLKTPIFIRKFNGEKVFCVNSNEILTFDTEDDKRVAQISLDGTKWTGPFSIDTLEDFQTKLETGETRVFDLKRWQKGENRFVRVIVYTKDEATIHISLLKPKEPEYIVYNHTKEVILACQFGNNMGNVLTVPPGEMRAWAFDDFLVSSKRIELTIGDEKRDYNLEKIEKRKMLGKYYTEVVVSGVTRAIKIGEPNEESEDGIEVTEKFTEGIKILLEIPLIGLSVMDYRNTEQLYISLTSIYIKLKNYSMNASKGNIKKLIKFDVRLEAFQIDNMNASNLLFPVIFSKIKYEKEMQDDTPFLQMKLHQESMIYADNQPSLDKIKWFEVSLQTAEIKINEETIYVLISLAELSNVFDSSAERNEVILDTSSPVVPYKLSDIKQKYYFEFIRFCAVRLNLNFEKAPQSSTSGASANRVLALLSIIGGAFTNISDSPIKFNEVLITHGFQTLDNLTSVFSKNYLRQAILQFYKVIGSSDMLGNPIGLIDKLGKGVFEFVSEPAKGILMGPKAFASGIGKGVKGLVGNIISGGFGSVSKITGSLYNVLSNVSGDAPQQRRDSAKLGTFMYEGFKGGVMDVANGITGVFTKPFKGAKEQGAKGFFKGVGSGIFGLVSSPVKLVLRFGTTITSGIASSGNLLANGKIHRFGRIRFPRQIGHKRILQVYNGDIAQAQELLRNEHPGMRLLYYLHYTEEEDYIVIATRDLVWVLVNAETLGKMVFENIEYLEVHLTEGKYCLEICGKRGKIKIVGRVLGELVPLYYYILGMVGEEKKLGKDYSEKVSRVCL